MEYLKRENVYIFLSNDGVIQVLPSFFSQASFNTYQIFTYARIKITGGYEPYKRKIKTRDESRRTIEEMMPRLLRFLKWAENVADYHWEIGGVRDTYGLHNHHLSPSEILNDYINDYLISEQKVSEAEAKAHITTLNAYFAYLEIGELIEDGFKDLYIRPELLEEARNNTNKKTGVKYLTNGVRDALYEVALTEFGLRDEIILRCGGEIGVRSCELRGFVLDDFAEGKSTFKGLKSLFDDLEATDDVETPYFKFRLHGRYSKAKPNEGGESRWLDIPYNLLERMKDYYEGERPSQGIESKFLFLNESNNLGVTNISARKGTDVFRVVAKKLNKIKSKGILYQNTQEITDQTFHILRHSFGTDLFWSLSDGNPERIVSTSKEFMHVAERMGHRINNMRKAGKTTIKYIRSAQVKQALELAEVA
ncbi:hypothetical protein BIZ37_04370 [Photobacterium sp. BZF1]|uniref:hypothetical protein n=1 Tax=Photobacterium sp. BZF1 TaxID=1904457 RepID=UPI001653BD3A|nr:hypothetical protein [Photobacterium sp. BZF1]MBC7001779.1 hypothetical protein [Photobacterium sp. BZF1]